MNKLIKIIQSSNKNFVEHYPSMRIVQFLQLVAINKLKCMILCKEH